MSNKISRSGERKLAILTRASYPYGCLVNRKWCFALTEEPEVKALIGSEYVRLIRKYVGGMSRGSFLFITPKGEKYRKTLERKRKT